LYFSDTTPHNQNPPLFPTLVKPILDASPGSDGRHRRWSTLGSVPFTPPARTAEPTATHAGRRIVDT
jgi:hypothetical protein